MKEIKIKKNEMPLKHETFKGTFIDYRGMTRDFTMVAVSIPVKEGMSVIKQIDEPFETDNSMSVTSKIYDVDYCAVYPYDTQASVGALKTYPINVSNISPVRKMLSIGVAVRCTRDKDLGLGEFIAYGKALRNAYSGNGHVLFVSHSGMINTKMVRALLEQEAEHFAKDPGSYIKGYNFDRDRFLKTGYIAQAELTTDEYANKVNNPPVVKKEFKNVETQKIDYSKALNDDLNEPKQFVSNETVYKASSPTFNTDPDPQLEATASFEPEPVEEHVSEETPVKKPKSYMQHRLGLS